MDFQQFQEEFNKLKQEFPLPPNKSSKVENTDYGDYLYDVKNAYFTFDTSFSKDLIYIFDSFKAVNCCDGDYVIESENCYECIDVLKAYNCTYLNYCGRIYDSHFCWDCGDSNNLFGCTHLSFKKFCIFNKQYTEEEYYKKVKELLKRTPEENLRELKDLAMTYPVTVTNNNHSENSDYGNHIDYSRNMYLCFDCAHSEDCGYCYDAHHNNFCYDLTQSFHNQFCYECVDIAQSSNCFFVNKCGSMSDSSFCEECRNSNHLFGCYGLDKQEYCILNKKYSKEDYEKNVKEIMDSYRKQFK
jgi:hypothetical protein